VDCADSRQLPDVNTGNLKWLVVFLPRVTTTTATGLPRCTTEATEVTTVFSVRVCGCVCLRGEGHHQRVDCGWGIHAHAYPTFAGTSGGQ